MQTHISIYLPILLLPLQISFFFTDSDFFEMNLVFMKELRLID